MANLQVFVNADATADFSAGLDVGSDSRSDETRVAKPFLETLRAIKAQGKRWREVWDLLFQ